MNRHLRPRMMNSAYRSPQPYNHQWRPNYTPSTSFPWRGNSHFGANNTKNESSEEHWCETCDRGFPSVELLQKHKQQHQKCNIDGCQFIAHPKVITKHIQMQHSTGLYKKIANLNNPEDIQKWRDERKKKYPTKSNIEKKAAECKEKIERGEKMALRHDHRGQKRQSNGLNRQDQRPAMKRKSNFDKRNQFQKTNSSNNFQPAKKIAKVIPSAPATDERNKLRPFTGIINIQMDDEVEDIIEAPDKGLFENDDYEEVAEIPKKTNVDEKPLVCGALTSLMCVYGSSDEEADEKENEVKKSSDITMQIRIEKPPLKNDNKVDSPDISKHTIIEKCDNESDDDPPVEIKIEKSNVEHENTQETFMRNKEKPTQRVIPPRNPNQQNYKVKRKIPSTLLQKLLHKEIRQERNIVLQCIRFIRKNNYFDKTNQ